MIGLAGGVTPPPFSETGSVGIYGKGEIGVKGQSDSGTGRGGMFESISAAQVQLIPHKPVELIPDQPFDVQALDLKDHETTLPANGHAGDLLCTSMQVGFKAVAVLWFCVTSGTRDDPALWRQVLLGPEFRGLG